MERPIQIVEFKPNRKNYQIYMKKKTQEALAQHPKVLREENGKIDDFEFDLRFRPNSKFMKLLDQDYEKALKTIHDHLSNLYLKVWDGYWEDYNLTFHLEMVTLRNRSNGYYFIIPKAIIKHGYLTTNFPYEMEVELY